MSENYQNIKSWAEEDRPREKMKMKGYSALTDAELVAIILGSGSRNESAVQLAQRMLLDNDGLEGLAKKDINHFKKYKGIGDAKAITLAATLELGRRRKEGVIVQKPKISSSNDAFMLMGAQLADLPYEEFWMMCCNRRNQVIWTERISRGGVAGTVVDAKIIFKIALEHLSSGILLFHNHPSGQTIPSDQDKQITRKIAQAAKLLDMNLLDHLIIGGKTYFSFADEGLI